MNHKEEAAIKREKFLALLRDVEIPTPLQTKLLKAYFESEGAAWKHGFESCNDINNKYCKPTLFKQSIANTL